MEPSAAIGDGPNSTVPSPTPVGCEQLPFTDGVFRAESTKAKAPDEATMSLSSGRASMRRPRLRNPATTKGAAATVHNSAWRGGRKPSATCMATIIATAPRRSWQRLRDMQIDGSPGQKQE